MKNNFSKSILLLALSLTYACGNKSQEHTAHDMSTAAENGNQVLLDQVMDIHDEVMPKTEDLYNITKGLKATLKEAKTDAEKQLLQQRINYLDSVNNMMMDWMHNFEPLPDTTNEETARAYYETNLEKVRQVKEAILLALEKENPHP